MFSKRIIIAFAVIFLAVVTVILLLGRTPERRPAEAGKLPAEATPAIATAGAEMSMAIMDDGSLWGFGWYVPDLYTGYTKMLFSPIPMHMRNDVLAVSKGPRHKLLIASDGTLWAWGSNSFGQLGDGTVRSQYSPARIMDNAAYVSTGWFHTCVITTDGTLWTWGANGSGQLGDGTASHSNVPIRIMDDVIDVSAGLQHTLAVTSDGVLWAWGANGSGQLGDGAAENRHSPVYVMNGVVAVSAGFAHSMAITSDGVLWAWGDNSYGQLGDGTATSRPEPIPIMENVITVLASDSHTLAITSGGALWAWGDNSYGQLGDGTAVNRCIPVHIMDDVIAVSAGEGRVLAITATGEMWSWGRYFIGYRMYSEAIYASQITPAIIMDSDGFSPQGSVLSGRWLVFESTSPTRERYGVLLSEQPRLAFEFVFNPNGTLYIEKIRTRDGTIIEREIHTWEFTRDGRLKIDQLPFEVTILRGHNSLGIYNTLILSGSGSREVLRRRR